MAELDEPSVNNSTDQPTISPDNEPGMFNDFRSQSWFGWLERVVVVVIVVLIIIFGGRWLHHKISHKNPAPAPVVTNQSSTSTNKKSQSKASGSSKNSSSSSSQGSEETNGQQLSNTGPGDVVAVFLTASVVAAGLHYAINLKKES